MIKVATIGFNITGMGGSKGGGVTNAMCQTAPKSGDESS